MSRRWNEKFFGFSPRSEMTQKKQRARESPTRTAIDLQFAIIFNQTLIESGKRLSVIARNDYWFLGAEGSFRVRIR